MFEVSHNTTGGPCGVTDGDCSARRVAQSTRGDGAFKYEFHPGWSRYEEPEGLTWWDLTVPNAPAVPGVTSSGLAVADTQLHAILLDNDPFEDDVYVKHYRVEVPPMTGIAVDPSVVAFDRTDVGASKSETVRISNYGSADLSAERARDHRWRRHVHIRIADRAANRAGAGHQHGHRRTLRANGRRTSRGHAVDRQHRSGADAGEHRAER